MDKTALKARRKVRGESDQRCLRRTASSEKLSLDLVSAYGGDREMTAADRRLIRTHQEERGDLFYSDLLYSVTHHHFDPAGAKRLWQKILSHKLRLSAQLDRDVRMAVATLDYLSNITGDLKMTTLISESYVAEISSLAMRDGMTGLFNHTTCHELLALELRNHRRYGVGVCLLLLDVDDFKSINDSRGHPAGDVVLVQVAETLVHEARACDICCRIGGDEFVVILRLTNEPSEACGLAERIRARAARIGGNGHPLGVSIGVAFSDRGATTPKALLERADRALRRAKKAGKNRVSLSDSI